MRRFLAVPALFALLALACTAAANVPTATSPPAAATPTAVAAATPTAAPSVSIDFSSEVSRTLYDVDGLTGVDIFASIDANGPRLDSGELGLGLASWRFSDFRWQLRPADGGCAIGSASFEVDIIVTLPNLVSRDQLGTDLRQRWDELAESVAAHEQTHVDIVLAGVTRLEQELAGLGSESSCSVLEASISSLWEEQRRLIDAEQAAFHAADEARLEALRKPIQAEIDANGRQVDTLAGRILSLEEALTAGDTSLGVMSAELEILRDEIDELAAAYEGRALPGEVHERYEALRTTHNAMLGEFNALIDRYNAELGEHSALVDQHNALRVATNNLIEDLRWLQ